jgi:hypothetical protein
MTVLGSWVLLKAQYESESKNISYILGGDWA